MVLSLGFSQTQKQGQNIKENEMKRLIKTATLVASVGAMLCFVGCGESNNTSTTSAKTSTPKALSPREEMVEFSRKVNAELAKHGAEPMISDAQIAELETKQLEQEELDALVKIRSTFPVLQKYSSVLKEINDLCEQSAGKPIFKKDDISGKFGEFFEKSDAEQQQLVDALQSVPSQLKVYSSVIKEVNALSEKLGGHPWVDKGDLVKTFNRFIEKSFDDRQSDIDEAKDILKRLKEARR